MRARGLPIEIPCSEPTMADLGPHLVPSVADLVGPRPVDLVRQVGSPGTPRSTVHATSMERCGIKVCR